MGLRVSEITSQSPALLAFYDMTPPTADGFPSQRASNVKSATMSWRHIWRHHAIPCIFRRGCSRRRHLSNSVWRNVAVFKRASASKVRKALKSYIRIAWFFMSWKLHAIINIWLNYFHITNTMSAKVSRERLPVALLVSISKVINCESSCSYFHRILQDALNIVF